MPTLPNMSLITPTAGGDSGTWDDKINACFALLDAHDHTSGKGVQITVAGLDIDDDLPVGGNGLIGVGRVDFNQVETLGSGANVLFVDSDDGELYWRTAGGANVKLTDGASINTTLVGGIVGDYSSVGAEVSYSDADRVYTFKDEDAKWTRVATGPVRIYENDTTESVYVELVAPAGLALSYTITLPTAAPAGPAFLQMDASGNITASNRMANEMTIPGTMAMQAASSLTSPHSFIGYGWSLGNSNAVPILYPITLPVGSIITGFRIVGNKASNASNTLTATLAFGTSGNSDVVGFPTVTNNGNAPGAITMLSSPAGSHTVVSGYQYWVKLIQSNATPSAADSCYMAAVFYE